MTTRIRRRPTIRAKRAGARAPTTRRRHAASGGAAAAKREGSDPDRAHASSRRTTDHPRHLTAIARAEHALRAFRGPRRRAEVHHLCSRRGFGDRRQQRLDPRRVTTPRPQRLPHRAAFDPTVGKGALERLRNVEVIARDVRPYYAAAHPRFFFLRERLPP